MHTLTTGFLQLENFLKREEIQIHSHFKFMAEAIFQLAQIFGTTDLLLIVGFKSIEFYQNTFDDITTLRVAYLRRVIHNHPETSGLTPDTQDGIKEIVARGKKLYIMNDIYKFLTDQTDLLIKQQRSNYFAKGSIPDFPSLRYLRDNSFKGDERDYKVPTFEAIAAELKALYQLQMKKIRELQETFVPDPEEHESQEPTNDE